MNKATISVQSTTTTQSKLSRTQDIPARKISVTKVQDTSPESPRGSLIGWEYVSPKDGCPYLIYLDRGTVLKTSSVQEIRETDTGVVIRTRNSTYKVEYLGLVYLEENAGT